MTRSKLRQRMKLAVSVPTPRDRPVEETAGDLHAPVPLQAGLPAPSASVNFLVPDCAILPRLFFRSALLIPIPLSSIVSVLASCRPKGSQVRVQAPVG